MDDLYVREKPPKLGKTSCRKFLHSSLKISHCHFSCFPFVTLLDLIFVLAAFEEKKLFICVYFYSPKNLMYTQTYLIDEIVIHSFIFRWHSGNIILLTFCSSLCMMENQIYLTYER